MTEKDTGPFKTGRIRKKSTMLNRWENIIESNLITKGSPSRDRIFASSAGLCERQTAGLIQIKDDFKEIRKASTQFYFKIGNSFEDVFYRAFKKEGVLIDRETRIEVEHFGIPLSGRIDFVLLDPASREPTLVELKTCGKMPSSPKPPHLAQLMTYLLVTGINRGLVWYVSRTVAGWDGILKQATFEVNPSEDELIQTARKIAIGSAYAQEGLLPDIPDDMKRYKCGFCPLIPLCWEPEKHNGLGIEVKSIPMEKRYELLRKADVMVKDVMENRNELKALFYKELGIKKA